MIRTIDIENYKSISKLRLELGRVTVLIGANGSGKSNILEAIALASAASQDKLDNEFLISRGIRVTETRFMRSAFDDASETSKANQVGFTDEEPTVEIARDLRPFIRIAALGDDDVSFRCEIFADETASFPRWKQSPQITPEELVGSLKESGMSYKENLSLKTLLKLATDFIAHQRERSAGALPRFLVYAPENSALRTFQAEGQILPLGIRGEGLFAHLKGLESEQFKERLHEIRENLKLIEWFETFLIPENLNAGERAIKIQDRFLAKGALFDQRSANEGFLFLLFYITLFISPETPAFFSIDNIDNSLNPKMCTALVRLIIELAEEHDKQNILTSHNPAVLDGLDLADERQRLLVVDRDKRGQTRVRRVDPPKPSPGQQPISLSEAFMRGYLGGLPKNF